MSGNVVFISRKKIAACGRTDSCYSETPFIRICREDKHNVTTDDASNLINRNSCLCKKKDLKEAFSLKCTSNINIINLQNTAQQLFNKLIFYRHVLQ